MVRRDQNICGERRAVVGYETAFLYRLYIAG